MKTVDARGRACPEPVIMTKKALSSQPDGVCVLTDNLCAVENITRFAQNTGWQIKREGQDGEWTLRITK